MNATTPQSPPSAAWPPPQTFFSNTFRLLRFHDHVIVEFRTTSAEPFAEGTVGNEEPDRLVGRIAIPIATAGELAVSLFDALIRCGFDLAVRFSEIQASTNALNDVTAEVERKKAERQAAGAGDINEGAGFPKA